MGSSQSQASTRWKQKNYERFMLEFSKGTKDELTEYVKAQGLTMRSYILGLIEQDSGIDMHIHKAKKEQ